MTELSKNVCRACKQAFDWTIELGNIITLIISRRSFELCKNLKFDKSDLGNNVSKVSILFKGGEASKRVYYQIQLRCYTKHSR